MFAMSSNIEKAQVISNGMDRAIISYKA
jgi:hypothetical protein